MSLEDDIKTALKPLVGNRVSENTLPQYPQVAEWPAIRFQVIDRVPIVDICGDGDDDTSTPRVQIDVIATTVAQARSIRLAVMAAMRTFTPVAILDNSGSEYDAESKTHRQRLDYIFHGSS